MANIGNAYTSSGDTFTGDTVTERLNLIGLPYTDLFNGQQKWVYEIKNININNLSDLSDYTTIALVGFGVTSLSVAIGIYWRSNGDFYIDSGIGGSYHSATITPSGTMIDFKIETDSNGANPVCSYRQSGSENYITALSLSGSVSTSYYNENVVINALGTNLSDVTFTANGTVLFSRNSAMPSIPIPKIGSNDISKIYLGTEEIGKIYLGSEVVYEAEVEPTPTPIGDVYDGVNLYTGNTIDKTLYLLQPQGTSLALDCSKSFSMTRKNIVATAYPSGTRSGFQCTFNESYTTIFSMNFGPSGKFFYMFTVNGNDKIPFNQSHAYPLNTSFDIRIDYDASSHVFSFKYKLSSSDTWTILSSITYTISLSNPIHLTVSGESNAVTSELSGVEVVSDGTVLFQRS